MPLQTHIKKPTTESHGLDRRALIKRSIALAGAGYVAPMVLGSAKPASAQAVSTTCSEAIEPPCNTSPDNLCGDDGCSCVGIIGGGMACAVSTCNAFGGCISCTSSSDCPEDAVCMDNSNTCCTDVETECGPSAGACVALCGTFEFPNQPLRRNLAASTPWWKELR